MPLCTHSFAFLTLGCKVNQYETQALREAWTSQGHREVPDLTTADLICVNSCAVTARAVADVRGALRRARRANPKAVVLLTGCAAKLLAQDLDGLAHLVVRQEDKDRLRVFPLPDAVAGQSKLPVGSPTPHADTNAGSGAAAHAPVQRSTADVPSLGLIRQNSRPFPETLSGTARPVARTMGDQGKHPSRSSGSTSPESMPLAAWTAASMRDMADAEVGDAPHTSAAPAFPDLMVSGYDRSRAVVKVQDGCSHCCAYCIVPLTRGPSRSRPVPDILAELIRLLNAGFREITLSGINLRLFGRDLPGKPDFWDLLGAVDKALAAKWAGRARLRLSSLEPGQLNEKALGTLASCRMVAPHLHLSLQSGSPSVLHRMNRGHYDPSALPFFLRDLAGVWPLFGLGADILTGFPGETDAEFGETLALCRELPFSYAHVFPFSIRPGTAAASLPDQVDTAVKKQRAAVLRRAVREKRRSFLLRCLTLPTVQVAAEGDAAGKGVSEHYLDCRLTLPQDALRHQLIAARPVGLDGDSLLVEAIQA